MMGLAAAAGELLRTLYQDERLRWEMKMAQNEIAVTIIGNLTAAPETRGRGKNAAAAFSVASTPRVYDGKNWTDGNTSYMNCVAFGRWRDIVLDNLQKGTRVVIIGHLRQSEYEDKDGEKKRTWQLIADEIAISIAFHDVKATKRNEKR